MKKNVLIILLAAIITVSYFPTYAEDDDIDKEIKMYMGDTKVINVSSPIRIVIGNPGIVDVAEVTKSNMVINSVAVGSTTLVFWDNFGEQTYKVQVFSEDLSDDKRRIDSLLEKLNLPGVYTQAEEEEAKVFILGRVKTAQDLERIQVALGKLSAKTVDLVQVREEEAVIEIEAQVLELSKDASDTLGFTWPGTVTLTDVSGPTTTATSFRKVFHLSDFTRTAFNFTLDALVQEGKARILSRPSLACQSGKEAELLVGGEKPTFTTQVASAGGQGTSVSYKEYGIKLKIKPTVLENDRIKLGVNVEVSEIGDAETIGSATAPSAKAYPLTKRTASTELFLNNSQTLVIGGLIKRKEEEDVRRVPFLSEIPIVGVVFRKKTTKSGGGQGQRGETELFITITPTIVSRGQEAKGTESKIKKSELKDTAASGKTPEIIPVSEAAEPIKETPAQLVPDKPLDPIISYSRIVQKRVLENLSYPLKAKEAGFQGTVKLGLRISYSGKLIEAVVKQSSGYKVLDEQAVSVAKGIESFPPFPSTIDKEELWVDVPILYKLD